MQLSTHPHSYSHIKKDKTRFSQVYTHYPQLSIRLSTDFTHIMKALTSLLNKKLSTCAWITFYNGSPGFAFISQPERSPLLKAIVPAAAIIAALSVHK